MFYIITYFKMNASEKYSFYTFFTFTDYILKDSPARSGINRELSLHRGIPSSYVFPLSSFGIICDIFSFFLLSFYFDFRKHLIGFKKMPAAQYGLYLIYLIRGLIVLHSRNAV